MCDNKRNRKILLFDETTFHMYVIVNRHNLRIRNSILLSEHLEHEINTLKAKINVLCIRTCYKTAVARCMRHAPDLSSDKMARPHIIECPVSEKVNRYRKTDFLASPFTQFQSIRLSLKKVVM